MTFRYRMNCRLLFSPAVSITPSHTKVVQQKQKNDSSLSAVRNKLQLFSFRKQNGKKNTVINTFRGFFFILCCCQGERESKWTPLSAAYFYYHTQPYFIECFAWLNLYISRLAAGWLIHSFFINLIRHRVLVFLNQFPSND